MSHATPALDLGLGEDQHELQRMLTSWCRGRVPPMPRSQVPGPRPFPAEVWSGLASLGVLALGSPDGGGGALEIVAAMEVLGAFAAPGPLVATYLATAVLPTDRVAAVVAGDVVVGVPSGGHVPWGDAAGVFVDVSGDRAWLADGRTIAVVDTLAREPWAEVVLHRTTELDPGALAVALDRADVALAAYLTGAAGELLALATQHARSRVQFGRTIGEFQAVAHPLARAHCAVTGARDITRVAAFFVDAGEPGVRAATARLAAVEAALATCHVAHQMAGALGYTEEAPFGRYSRQIRQWVDLAPGNDRANAVVAAATRLL